MHFLSAIWLSPALQAVTIIVLIVTCWAALKQANAAVKLTRATEQQIETSKSMAESANTQNELARRQFEEGVRPFLTLVVILHDAFSEYRVRNDGAGPALGCFFYYGRIDTTFPKPMPLESEAIASDQDIWMTLDVQKAGNEGLVLVCQSMTGSHCATEYTWHGDSQRRCRYILNVPDRVSKVGAELRSGALNSFA